MKKHLLLFLSAAIMASITFKTSAGGKSPPATGYEVWASDQSNSVSWAETPGSKGSYLWIWDSADIERQLSGGMEAQPIGCGRNNQGRSQSNTGPCDLLEVFPQNLAEHDANGLLTGDQLGDLDGFGRLHGMLPDPQNQYVTANIFAPGGGYVGIIDTSSKEAIALFRVTGSNVNGGEAVRSVHMSFWTLDGSSIIVANLNGKLLERIDVSRNGSGKIKKAVFNRSATLGVGKNMAITEGATVFLGTNAHNRKMIGSIGGDYSDADLGNLTPNGECKENNCDPDLNAASGGRPNNVIICPIPSASGRAYVTMGGGGLLVADTRTTPMTIVGEYGNEVINGAGCGGAQSANYMWLNAGVSAAGAGANQSTFTLYALDDSKFDSTPNPPNFPAPTEVLRDEGNTATLGNLAGDQDPNETGQIPGITTRRDSHGMAVTEDGAYIHTVDRIQNTVTACHVDTHSCAEYDLTSFDGQGNNFGACMDASVGDDGGLPANDPAPDLLERTPDGKYLMIGLRGPRPVSVTHSAQGSCPGVGVVELLDGGASGRLVGVLRASNAVDTVPTPPPAGGYAYSGLEHSDVHAATVVRKKGSFVRK